MEERKWDCFVQNLPAGPPASQPGSARSFLPFNLSSRSQLQRRDLSCEARWSPGEGEESLPLLNEVAQCRAGPLLCGHGFPEAQGAHPGKRPCSLALSAAPSQGISFPLLFSIVAILSRVPRTQPESKGLPTHWTFQQQCGVLGSP